MNLGVPGQQCSRRDKPVGAQHTWQQPGQRGQDRAFGPVRLRLADLTPENCDFMTEHHDLRILGRLVATEQEQPVKDPDHDQIEEATRHRPRSCPTLFIWPNRRSQPLRRVLMRYRSHQALARRSGARGRGQRAGGATRPARWSVAWRPVARRLWPVPGQSAPRTPPTASSSPATIAVSSTSSPVSRACACHIRDAGEGRFTAAIPRPPPVLLARPSRLLPRHAVRPPVLCGNKEGHRTIHLCGPPPAVTSWMSLSSTAAADNVAPGPPGAWLRDGPG